MIAAIVLTVIVAAALLYGAAVLGDREDPEDARTAAWVAALHHEEYLPAPTDMGPRAGVSGLSPVTTATCPGESTAAPKVDSPAPADPAAEPISQDAAPPPASERTPLHAARAAMEAVAAMDPADYHAHLTSATAWEDRPPFASLLSADTITRGLPAIRVDGDADWPLSAPREWLAELENTP